MTIAILLWPHANSRYYASLRELSLAELGILLSACEGVGKPFFQELSGIEFLCFEADAYDDALRSRLARFSSGYAVFAVEGECMQPLQAGNRLLLGTDISGILKYKGKTNEMFSGLLINTAVFSSAYRDRFSESLCVLDPMCGRGTSLFEALRRGYKAVGVEIDKTDVQQTEQFLKRYLEYNRYKYELKKQSLTVPGAEPARKTQFCFAQDAKEMRDKPFSLELVQGDTLNFRYYAQKPFAHALVCDLPYGVFHESRDGKDRTALDAMMKKALIAWKSALLPGAGVALSFNSNTLPLIKARQMLEDAGYEICTGGEYDRFSHWVEQAIQRDVAVARFPGKNPAGKGETK